MNKEDRKGLSMQERLELMRKELTETAKKKGMKVRTEPMKGIQVTFHPKPPVK